MEYTIELLGALAADSGQELLLHKMRNITYATQLAYQAVVDTLGQDYPLVDSPASELIRPIVVPCDTSLPQD